MPQPAVCAFLERLAERSPDWCTLALSTARDCLVQRPPSRASLLQLVLAAAAAPTADMRTKAVRLAANRLYPDPSMAPAIELAAQQRLDAMVAAPQSGPGSPGGAAAARQDEQPPIEQPGSAGSSGGAGESTSPAGQLAAGPTDVEAAQLCALYCALCTKKHSLLRHLFEVYGTTSGGWLAGGHAGQWMLLCHELVAILVVSGQSAMLTWLLLSPSICTPLLACRRRARCN